MKKYQVRCADDGREIAAEYREIEAASLDLASRLLASLLTEGATFDVEDHLKEMRQEVSEAKVAIIDPDTGEAREYLCEIVIPPVRPVVRLQEIG